MPIYIFVCESCGKKQEHIVSMEDQDKVVCEDCGGKLKSVPAAFSFTGTDTPQYYHEGKRVKKEDTHFCDDPNKCEQRN